MSLAIVKSEPIAADPLAELIAERDGLEAEYGRLSAVRAKLAALADEETAVLAEIGEIGAREMSAVKAWAARGADGEKPPLLFAEREDAARRLAEAQARAKAGEEVIREIEAEQAEIHGRALDSAQKIEALIFDHLENEFRAEAQAIDLAMKALRERTAALAGLTKAILNVADGLQRQGRHEEARAYYVRAERLPTTDLREVAPTGAEIEEHAAEWIARAEAMRRAGK